jgi:hypothetical protein
MTHARRTLRSATTQLCVGGATAVAAIACLLPPVAAAAGPTPIYAYYYIWFNASSWNRAKVDYPVLGRYSSDEASIMRRHIRLAKDAGIDGFIVSWKSTPVLDQRLSTLIAVAQREHFKLAMMYQGLDYERRPLPVEKVRSDLDLFVHRFASSPVFRGFGKPVVAWSGTWAFTRRQVESVTAQFRDPLLLLATERNLRDYRSKASAFDGDAYYWSSANPRTYPRYEEKLAEMGAAAHETGGLWFAPAAPGFDARLIGGTSVVPRRDGATLRTELDAAEQSSPDVIGLISWNEFTENSHVEPSTRYGTKALEVVADVEGTQFTTKDELDSSELGIRSRSRGPGPVPATAAFLLFGVITVVVLARRKRRSGRSPRSDGGPPTSLPRAGSRPSPTRPSARRR